MIKTSRTTEKNIKIGNKIIGNRNPVFIVAELSANHLQKYDLAEKTIRAARKAGADAIKLQTYTPDTLTIKCDNEYFKLKHGTLWDGKTLYELYGEAYTPWEWHPRLKKVANRLGMILFSTPFDKTAVDFLEKIGVPAYKVASFEIFDTPLIEYIASKGKPIIMSTGIADLNDIKDAIEACKRMKNNKIILLKCTSEYPTPYEDANLNTIPDMEKRFGYIVGISDHTVGIEVPIGAVALGAKLIEKHFILDRNTGSPDSKFSLNPQEFRSMVDCVRNLEKAMGKANYEITSSLEKSRVFARSLFVVEDVKKGELFTEKNVRSIRPGYGLRPKHIKKVLGKMARMDIKRGTPLRENMF